MRRCKTLGEWSGRWSKRTYFKRTGKFDDVVHTACFSTCGTRLYLEIDDPDAGIGYSGVSEYLYRAKDRAEILKWLERRGFQRVPS